MTVAQQPGKQAGIKWQVDGRTHRAELGEYRAEITAGAGPTEPKRVVLTQGSLIWDRFECVETVDNLQICAGRWLRGGRFWLDVVTRAGSVIPLDSKRR